MDTASLPPLASAHVVSLESGAYRTMFRNAFLELHVPKTDRVQRHYLSLLETCMDLSTSQPSLLCGLDALSLVQLGSVENDRRLIESARQNYTKALTELRSVLSTQQALHDDHVLAAVMIMKYCELYTELASPKGVGWAGHVCAAQRLLTVRGPALVRSDLSMELYANARQSALCYSLVDRKACALAQPGWRAIGNRTRVKDKSFIFHELALQIPGLLEQHDGLDIQHHDQDQVTQIDVILAKAAAIEQDLRAWLLHWATDEPQYETRPVDDFSTFATQCSDRTFSTAFAFGNFMAAYLHSMYWICMYFLRITIRALHAARAVVIPSSRPHANQQVSEEEILEYVFNACRCIPYFCEPASSTMGCIGMFLPLRTAAFYFVGASMVGPAEWIGNVDELEWRRK
ncbi:hypothetical protein LTR78_005338 [Recurvomyces mirabilis]|uniref:Transcription factor domain-containing protein n=1 Tax=Recurvomyces mirabilis TaxID=574656 RepID=A0AAE0WMR9_9PEZI|nr:hypothetical protein LTR78_005338 [Recurvomyces mirabilis]KAK5152755.1 hypothetical protein LTS14_008289 [Recurvomyces mirabilis]